MDVMVQTQGSFPAVAAQPAGAAGLRRLLQQRGVQVGLRALAPCAPLLPEPGLPLGLPGTACR